MIDCDAPIRGEVRLAGYRRLSHGLYLQLKPGLDQGQETLRDLKAWRLVLPDEAVFTHVTGAALNNWWLPHLPEFVPVFAAVNLDSDRPRRPGLICSRLDREPDPASAQGLPVDSAQEVLLRSARDLSTLDMVVMLDSALRLQHLDLARVDEIIASGRPGVARLRAARNYADPRSESPWETILRLFHVLAEVDVQPQKEIFDEAGRFVARVDLYVKGTCSVHEYDGGEHLRVARQGKDLRRARRLAETPFRRRGYTADDLLNHDLVVLHELDRVVGRAHRPSRIRPWRRWLAESSYSVEGRRRLQNRWLRLTGMPDWAKTA